MQHSIAIILCIVLFTSCNRCVSIGDTNDESAVDTCISFPEPEEGIYNFSDNIYSTDWMQHYGQYVRLHFEERGDLWGEKSEDNPVEGRYWTLAYVDDDTIPEMLLYGGCQASRSIILTQHKGKVYSSPRGAFSYNKGGGGLLHSQSRYADEIFGAVYEMKYGQFVEKCNYYCHSALIDTNDIANYGLGKEDLSRYQIGDGTVGVNEIIFNGERIGTCYGYNQWQNSHAFGKVKQTLESLYYSKGTSSYFPFPSESMGIGNMINAAK